MERYDIAIIGTGPAGLEAAITAKIRNKNIILFGAKELSMKISKAHLISNYLGLPQVTGEDLQKAFLNQLEQQNIEITDEKVKAVYSMGKYFAIQGGTNEYEAKSVILACGLSTAKAFEGELENLGRGVSYCATCDAALYRNKSAIVIGYSADEENEAKFLAEIADKVFYIPMYKTDVEFSEKIEVIREKKPIKIEKGNEKMTLILDEGTLEADGIFILRESISPSQLVAGLKTLNNHIEVDRMMKTNIEGMFACGDITGAPYQYIKAAGDGNVAALSAVKYLASS